MAEVHNKKAYDMTPTAKPYNQMYENIDDITKNRELDLMENWK